jgi:hypothetical protein
MKNIHLLPTDKPNFGRYLVFNKENTLCIWDTELIGGQKTLTPHHIYITSDEEIKEGDCFLHPDNTIEKASRNLDGRGLKKIILTTDQDLIADGVQAIDDEFLEWFVKNPSCEFVKTKLVYDYEEHPELVGNPKEEWSYYKIIIPQDEPKQYPIGGYAPGNYHCNCTTCKTTFQGDKRAVQCESCAIKATQEQPKQETLEEAAEMDETVAWELAKKRFEEIEGYAPDINNRTHELMVASLQEGILAGAKWQAERMYSEEDMHNLMDDYQNWLCNTDGDLLSFKEWFEQFKKI